MNIFGKRKIVVIGLQFLTIFELSLLSKTDFKIDVMEQSLESYG